MLIIEIKGNRDTGKTVLSKLIFDYLRLIGFDVSYESHSAITERAFTKMKLPKIEGQEVVIIDKRCPPAGGWLEKEEE